MSILPKVMYRFNEIPVNIPMACFYRNKKELNFIRNHKGPQIATEVLRKKNKTGVITLSDFKPCYTKL